MPATFDHGYALLIGIGECAYMPWSLPTTVRDTNALRTILANPDLCAYRDDVQHLRVLNDSAATGKAILDGLAWLKAQAAADPQATIVVYYSGHGWVDVGAQKFYLIAHDVQPFKVAKSALPAEAFASALHDIPAQRLLTLIDCCFAEGMSTSKDPTEAAGELPDGFQQAAPPADVLSALKQGQGRAVFTSSRGTQPSRLRPDLALSAYTYRLIEALQGAGSQPGETAVRLSNLMNYVGRTVPDDVRDAGQSEQTPFFDMATEDFPVALLRGGKGLGPGGWGAVAKESARTLRRVVQALGDRSVALGGDATDNVIVTGDHNTVQRGKYNVTIGKARGLAIGDDAQVDWRRDDHDE